ncbi:MAG TPA: hypothetical protein VG674_23520 [Amycolatopsis sp.]|nr:hypothetical protein [Amycolatopsis sp.]
MTETSGAIRVLRHATTTSFTAMREGLNDLRHTTADGFTDMRGKLDAAAAGQQNIVTLLTRAFGDPDDADTP